MTGSYEGYMPALQIAKLLGVPFSIFFYHKQCLYQLCISKVWSPFCVYPVQWGHSDKYFIVFLFEFP